MAKSSKSNRMKFKGYPTHRTLRYKLAHTNTDSTNRADDNHYIDLARDISALNFRKYDQGRVWGVSSFTLHDNQSHIHATIAGLRHNWPTYSAYKMARKAWRRQQNANKANVGAWQQFIVALSRDVITDPDCPLPLDTEDYSAKRGEWMLSQISYRHSSESEVNAGIVMTGASNLGTATQQPSATSDNLIGATTATSGPMYVRNTLSGSNVGMNAPNFSGTISAFDEWQKARPDATELPANDDDAADSVFLNMIQASEGSNAEYSYDEDIVARLEEEGDHPPYALDYAGLDDSGTNDGLWVYREARFASGQKTIMLPGAEIPLGLLKVVTNGAGDGTCYLDIEVAPGGYKGVHALEV